MREVDCEEAAGTLHLCWTLHSFFAMWHVNLYWKSSIDFSFRCSIFGLQMLLAS